MDKYKAEKKASQDKAMKLQQEKFDALRAAMSPEERAKADKRVKRTKMTLISIAVSFILLIVIGMLGGSGTSETSSTSTAVVADNSGVTWTDYSPTVKTRIEELIQAADCSGLHIADQNDAAQRNRVGVGNADLMNYINTSMQKLGCF
jgi:secreted PhoX family phosphatase